ncbi:2,3,4,5-tetrahydropyridine-2,6-dicarboxylate N-succinyltransferase [Candidatus Vidania fulgoroideorum]
MSLVTVFLRCLEKGIFSVVRKTIKEDKRERWKINIWVKMMIVFCIQKRKCVYKRGAYDRLGTRFLNSDDKLLKKNRIRLVYGNVIREGCFLSDHSVIMPCFINIGAYIGKGSMIDTWATVGSCAYIGNHVHISGGVGIGGVLEPVQNNPVIIENHCFIGARSEIAEGVHIQHHAVISMGVFLNQSTPIYDRQSRKFLKSGMIPSYSVVIPGGIKKDGCIMYAAIIVKRRDNATDKKTRINEKLR